MPNYIILTMVREVTDYEDVFLVVTKRNISILMVDKLNTPGTWHLKFQPEEETKYVSFSFDREILKSKCVCVCVCLQSIGGRHIAPSIRKIIHTASDSHMCNLKFSISHMKQREKDKQVKLSLMIKFIYLNISRI